MVPFFISIDNFSYIPKHLVRNKNVVQAIAHPAHVQSPHEIAADVLRLINTTAKKPGRILNSSESCTTKNLSIDILDLSQIPYGEASDRPPRPLPNDHATPVLVRTARSKLFSEEV